MFWLSRITEHGTYVGGLLGPSLVVGVGLGLMFVPLPLVSMAGVPEADSGAAASLLNVGRQVGGALGLAVIGTVAWTVVANSARALSHGASHAASHAASPAAVRLHSLAAGFDRAFLVAAAIALLMLVVTVTMIRVRRSDLGGS
jgi:hypothetical protein